MAHERWRDYFVYVQDPARCGVSLRAIPLRPGKKKVPKRAMDARHVVVSATSKLDAELTAHDHLCKKAPSLPRY